MPPYDAIIIGSGQGGNPLAHKLADAGWRVALIERDALGGTCVNVGCTPTKTMIASASAAQAARRAPALGVHPGDVRVHLGEVVARKDRLVQQWREGQEAQVAQRDSLDLYRAHARFTGPHTLDVDGQTLTSERIIIDTGARPRVPALDGIEAVRFYTNRDVMTLTEVPEHLLVLGGSYIGLEFGQMYRRFGSRVTVVNTAERIIAREDKEVSNALHEALAEEDMQFRLGWKPTGVMQQAEGQLTLTLEDDEGHTETLEGSHLLVAVGRVPNTDDLGLDAAGIATDDHGHITVNDRLETNVPGVWALGDVTGGPAFTHLSYDDHLIIYDHLLGDGTRSRDDRQIPYALYTDPELGRVGLTERQAREQGYRLKIGCIPMTKVARAIERAETAGLMKVVIDADTDRLLGAAILSTGGGELVHILMTLMMADAPWTLLKRAVYIHPTLAEGFFGLMEAVEEV